MTTESKKDPRSSGSRVLLGAAASALALGVGATVVGGVVAGSAAAYGALAGTVLVLAVFGLGGAVVDTVAGLMPAASLLVALLTYTLQVVLMGVVFAGLSRSGLLDDTLDRAWLAGVVIAGTFGWLITQVVLTTRLRMPAYEPVLTGARGADQGGDRA